MANSMVCHLESDATRFGNPPESHAFRDLVSGPMVQKNFSFIQNGLIIIKWENGLTPTCRIHY
jgi:hypothetical protein